jgi:1,4-alpha-glucan branching enzyme
MAGHLNFNTLIHAPHGATPLANGTIFRMWAPGASTAHVRGSFNGWSTSDEMRRRGEDFIAYVPGAEPGDEYKFFFSNSIWRTDARARQINESNNSNSVIVDPLAYEWQHPSFSPAPPEEWVVYQLHVGTFAGRNDPRGATGQFSGFADVAARVDHLVDLGVNAVMCNPFYEFPGSQSGGYNSISMYAPERTYGTPDDLKLMIDTLHANGIAIILDTVWNHFPSGSFLENYDGTQIYFDSPPIGTPWGPQADYDNPNVIDYFFDSIETVMGEYRIDGYRHDAIYEIISASQGAPGQQLVRDMMAFVRTRHADSYVLGEIYNNSAWNTSPGGIDLHGQYHEAYKNAIKDAVDAAAFGDPDMWRLAGALDGSGPWVEGDRVFNYYELHDEAWPLSGAGRTRAVKQIDTTWPHDDRYALGRTKIGNGVTLMAQGMPALLMGTEWAEDAGWEVEKIDWSHRQTYAGIFAFYRDMIGLRTTKRALFANSSCNVTHVNDGANVLAFERFGNDGRSYVIVANFSNTDFDEYRIGLPRSGRWGVVINSEDAHYQGTGFGVQPGYVPIVAEPLDGQQQHVALALPAHGMLILQHDPEFIEGTVELCIADIDIDRQTALSDFSILAQNFGTQSGAAHADGDLDGDGAVSLSDFSLMAGDFGCQGS